MKQGLTLEQVEFGVWERGQPVFLDLRVFHPSVCRYFKKSLQQCPLYEQTRKEKSIQRESFAD